MIAKLANLPVLRFNAGEFTQQADARIDVDKYGGGCRILENMIPRIYGGVERRPGTQFIYEAKDTGNSVRLIPFIYSSEIAYVMEFGDLYIRFYFDGEILLDNSTPVEVVSPYLEADLLQLQYAQVGDVVWIVHPSYAPRKLSRTTATTFTLTVIDFRKGPFLTRNDLLDPNVSTTAFMKPSSIEVGSSGTLTCQDAGGTLVSFFDDDHLNALFQLSQPRVDTIIKQSGAGTSSTIDIDGDFSFNTHGTWTGTAIMERRENSSSSSDWETFRTYVGNDDRNIQYSGTEEADNVEFRIVAEAGMSAAFRADITANTSTQDGIVRLTAINSINVAKMEVLKKLASTEATRRWFEGAWSDFRGYPTSVTFYDERCVYAGPSVVPAQTVE